MTVGYFTIKIFLSMVEEKLTYLFFTNESKKIDNGTLCFVVVGVDSILIMTFVGLR